LPARVHAQPPAVTPVQLAVIEFDLAIAERKLILFADVALAEITQIGVVSGGAISPSAWPATCWAASVSGASET